jgi:diguanylate cyclase (GGDEF)-like protein
VLLLGATVILQAASLREGVAAFAPVYSWVVLGVGLLLGWRFKRRQLVVALLVLFAADRALAYVPADGGPSTAGRIVFAAIALLLPLNLAALAWLTERSFSSWTGRMLILLFLLEALAIPLLRRPELAHVAPVLQHVFVPLGLPWLTMPQPALLASLAAIGLVTMRFVLNPTIIQSSFAWASIATFLALNSGNPGTTVYLATAGLALVISLIETSHRLAFSDELTGLPSRRALTDALMRLPDLYTVAMIDIDHFKKINDEYGHSAGDQVLRLIGSTLTRTEGGGRPFRYGGEEFAVLFPNKAADEVLPYLEDLRETIEASTFIVRGGNRPKLRPEAPARSSGGQRRVAITVSIGVAEPEESRVDPDDVVRAADQALYRAKRSGRNRVVVAE